jgi:hypothetical protein
MPNLQSLNAGMAGRTFGANAAMAINQSLIQKDMMDQIELQQQANQKAAEQLATAAKEASEKRGDGQIASGALGITGGAVSGVAALGGAALIDKTGVTSAEAKLDAQKSWGTALKDPTVRGAGELGNVPGGNGPEVHSLKMNGRVGDAKYDAATANEHIGKLSQVDREMAIASSNRNEKILADELKMKHDEFSAKASKINTLGQTADSVSRGIGGAISGSKEKEAAAKDYDKALSEYLSQMLGALVRALFDITSQADERRKQGNTSIREAAQADTPRG